MTFIQEDSLDKNKNKMNWQKLCRQNIGQKTFFMNCFTFVQEEIRLGNDVFCDRENRKRKERLTKWIVFAEDLERKRVVG